ncbi:hypothetical protein GPECTOR_50g649 [Gonium pectorale]|uniref:SCP domain-containing protein n=1 Tax=Gonium pectorale TaxID=33097 RepID=A0A150G8G9_GONPE|nr:hypothetical protein GPECTOR_50g649 [Gonium pectorale]|eukprot:KXZ45855.1 hypothetical protein GPECTOR_50g649 [Gonium pectorale]
MPAKTAKPSSPPPPPPPPSVAVAAETSPNPTTAPGTASPLAGGGGNNALLGGGKCPDAQAALDATNAYRARHSSPSLQWSVSLAASSQDYAELLAKTCNLVHSGSQEFGENLMKIATYPKVTDYSCTSSIDNWYEEVGYYSFTQTPMTDNWSKGVGHFTQLVWRATTAVGCGVAIADKPTTLPSGKSLMGSCKVVVCRYKPFGNVGSDPAFLANVLPQVRK